MSIENNNEIEINNNINTDNTAIETEVIKIEERNINETSSSRKIIFDLDSEEENIENKNNEKKSIHINKKIIGNAISSYLLIGVSSMFLFNKTDDNINNSFVKSHTKSAIVLHIGFFITWLLFMKIGFLKSITVFGTTGLNSIFSIFLFLGLFSGILYGAYKAHLGKYFLLGNMLKLPGMENIVVEEETEININERNKLIVILSFIPFIGYYLFPEHREKKLIRNTTKLNLLSTCIIIFLLISNQTVIASLFILGYLIFIVYSIVNLITKNEIPHIKLGFILSPEDSFFVAKSFKKYLKAFFKKKDFVNIRELLKSEKEKYILEEEKLEKELENKPDIKLPKELIYIPLVNLIFLLYPNTKYQYHISSGLSITFYLIITYILGLIPLYPSSINIFILIPIFYGTGYLKTRLAYKMPYAYWIYEKFMKIFNIVLHKSKEVKKIKDTDKDINLKPKERVVDNSNKEELIPTLDIHDIVEEIPTKEEIVPSLEIQEIVEKIPTKEEIIPSLEIQEIVEEIPTKEEIVPSLDIHDIVEEIPTKEEIIPSLEIQEIVEETPTKEEIIPSLEIQEIVEETPTKEEIIPSLEIQEIVEENNSLLKENTLSSFNSENVFEETDKKVSKENNNNYFDISALEDSIKN